MKKVLAIAIALAAGNAFAAILTSPQTATFTVSTRINPSCSISAANLTFPDYDPMAAGATVGSTAITLTCTKNAAYTVTLSAGNSGSYSARTMRGTGATPDTLSYNLYTDSGYTVPWGDSTAPAANQVTGSATSKAPFTLTVYGSIGADQDKKVDTYSDSITATVTF